MTIHLIALGANARSGRAANARSVARALGRLRSWFGPRLFASSLYATPAWPPGIGPDFVNAAALIDTPLAPGMLLQALHGMEARSGRVRETRWGERGLDLDLIGTGSLIRPDAATLRAWINLPLDAQRQDAPDRLILPHPRLQDRGFVLLPMAEIAPGWRHPLTGRSIAQMAQSLGRAERSGIRRLRTP